MDYPCGTSKLTWNYSFLEKTHWKTHEIHHGVPLREFPTENDAWRRFLVHVCRPDLFQLGCLNWPRLRQRAKAVIKANDGTPDLQDKLLKGKSHLDLSWIHSDPSPFFRKLFVFRVCDLMVRFNSFADVELYMRGCGHAYGILDNMCTLIC